MKTVPRMNERQVRKFGGLATLLVGLAIVGVSFPQNDWVTSGLGTLCILIGIFAWLGN